MIRGIYISASGMLAESLRTDVISNNLANVGTSGFKKDFAVTKDYASRDIRRINDGLTEPEIGSMGAGVWVDAIATLHTGGIMKVTGNQLDVAIDGKGYFAVETPAGVRYTRNGAFMRSAEGELVTSDGYRVQGQNGPILLNEVGPITISEDGRIFVNNVESNQFQLYSFTEENRLRKQGAMYFAPPDGVAAEPSTPTLRQGYLELSNVNVVGEMVNLIAGYRAYETNSKAVQTHDALLDKAVNEVARL